PKAFDPDEFRVEEFAPKSSKWVEVECPYCGESFDVRVLADEEGQSMVQNCQVCCKPVQLSVEVDDGEVEVFASRS
ncbi:MAG: CPXCG motif-containing cysteine-rich protein, partial [Elusimicrobiota bacterium]